MTGSELDGRQVEGRRAVHELLTAGRRRVRRIALAVRDDRRVLEELAALASEVGASVEWLLPEDLASRARTDAPQGVVAEADALVADDLEDLLADRSAFLVALDGVTDPHNLGAVLRSAEAAGATGVVIPRHRSAPITPTAVKAASGAVEHLRYALVGGIPAALERAARAQVWTVGLDGDGPIDLFELPLADEPLVLVLGAEGRGLGRLTRDRCDVVARIPMHGWTTSLNVSAAAAVACFEIARRRVP